MSDVIWAAIIAVMGSGIGSAIGARTTYLVAKRGSDTAIATAERQAEVELAKVRGELDRLRAEYREAERSNRQGTYHRMLAVLDRFDMYAVGSLPIEEADHMAALEEFNNLVGGIHLFGDQGVRDALGPLAFELGLVGMRLNQIRDSPPEGRTYQTMFSEAYSEHRRGMIDATAKLTEAMRADVTREILD